MVSTKAKAMLLLIKLKAADSLKSQSLLQSKFV